MIKNICVFCGAGSGSSKDYSDAARKLGALIARKGIGLIYGGGKKGMMGAISNAAIDQGGTVTGIIPKGVFSDNLINKNLTELKVTDSMHSRKALMSGLADAFIIMPGGIGTLEEFSEVFTWAQLGLHAKPIGLLNTNRYYDKLIGFFETSVTEGFFDSVHLSKLIISDNPARLLKKILDASK